MPEVVINVVRARVTGIVAAVAVVIGGVALIPVSAAFAATLTATIAQEAAWPGGYNGRVTVASTDPVTGWAVEFDLPATTTVGTAWEATMTRSGNHYRFVNLTYNAVVGPGQSRTFGFTANGSAMPTGCLVNGVSCAGGVPPTSGPPVSPSRSVRPSASASASPSHSVPPSPSRSPSPSSGPDRVVAVSTPAALRAALTDARAGDTIQLADGTYNGRFALSNKAGPIVVTGSRAAILDGGDPADGYGFALTDVTNVTLRGFTITRSQKAVVTERTTFSTLDGLAMHHIGDEAVALRRFSTDNVVRNSVITETGLFEPQFGEGVYIGTWNGNWASETGGQPDTSDRNQVLDNTFGPNVRAEHVDIKEGTRGGVVRGNHFDGRGISGQNFADSWVDAQGNGYVIENNVGTFQATSGSTFVDGYQTHILLDGWGCGNVFRGNTSDLGGVGQYAIRVQDNSSACAGNLNVVTASNTVTRATIGLTNIPVSGS